MAKTGLHTALLSALLLASGGCIDGGGSSPPNKEARPIPVGSVPEVGDSVLCIDRSDVSWCTSIAYSDHVVIGQVTSLEWTADTWVMREAGVEFRGQGDGCVRPGSRAVRVGLAIDRAYETTLEGEISVLFGGEVTRRWARHGFEGQGGFPFVLGQLLGLALLETPDGQLSPYLHRVFTADSLSDNAPLRFEEQECQGELDAPQTLGEVRRYVESCPSDRIPEFQVRNIPPTYLTDATCVEVEDLPANHQELCASGEDCVAPEYCMANGRCGAQAR